MIVLAVLIIAIILVASWAGMRLMQRTTGCADPAPERTVDEPSRRT